MTTGEISPVAVTCGDPSGIGPEIISGAWSALKSEVPFFLIGDPGHVPKDTPTVMITAPRHARAAMDDGLPILAYAFRQPAVPGRPDPANARPVVEVIERAVDLVQSGHASAMCTAPIAKKELVDHAAFAFPGHTEFLAHLSGADHPVMMLASDALKVVPTTIHIPLSEVSKTLTPELLERTLRITDAAMQQDFGIANPRIAVAGVNPHAGEGGLLGREEDAWIAPLMDRLRAEGFNLAGPHSADTMFHAAARESYDVAVAMYHDQALIPIKTLAFDSGVNVTLGLPFPRTSPDHGTAFDIAGTGQANPGSLIAALRMAWDMARARATGS